MIDADGEQVEVGNTYRDGRVHVCEEMCSTCIFRPGNLMRLAPGRLRGMRDDAIRAETAIVCHKTLDGDNAVCRGYYDRHSSDVVTLRLAARCGVIAFDPVDSR